jgi:hypothetical protein
MEPLPFILYADFECIVTGRKGVEMSVISYSCCLVRRNGQLYGPFMYLGEDAVDKFFKHIGHFIGYIDDQLKEIKRELDFPHPSLHCDDNFTSNVTIRDVSENRRLKQQTSPMSYVFRSQACRIERDFQHWSHQIKFRFNKIAKTGTYSTSPTSLASLIESHAGKPIKTCTRGSA